MRELLPVVAEIRDETVRGKYFKQLEKVSLVPEHRLLQLAAHDGRRGAPRAEARDPNADVAGAPMLMDHLEEGLLRCVVRAGTADVDLVSRLDPGLLTDPAARHILARIVAEAQESLALDWERVSARLDPTSQQRLALIRERAAQTPGGDASLSVELQFATLRLRERRLNAELEETRLVADGEAAEPITARRQELISEMDSVHRAKLELMGARSFAAG